MIAVKDQISSRDIETILMNRDNMEKAEGLTIQIFLLLGAALVSIGGRLYARWRQVGMKNLGLDDGLAIAGVVSISVMHSTSIICIYSYTGCRFSLCPMWSWRT